MYMYCTYSINLKKMPTKWYYSIVPLFCNIRMTPIAQNVLKPEVWQGKYLPDTGISRSQTELECFRFIARKLKFLFNLELTALHPSAVALILVSLSPI